ncbi:MAG TPA: tRNA (adenosine(37)-N6)-dimethylallyltransferase MiaA [Syntrophomonadaceae bacterium]|nr:tRNA (adenosine(37)-N6)-dimethylallyltransferase MiaA [Syntrophomonadaceae bacterium]
MLKLVTIVGPTAVGKTATAIQVAEKVGGEIISCDSMQVYRGMDIGTAKASIEEQQKIPHHLIDILSPDEDFSVADYQAMAKEKIQDITSRGKIPILVGGTGLYYQAVVDNYYFFPMESRQQARRHLENMCADHGLAYLYQILSAVDQEYAIKIGPNDKKRIIRALEVYHLTGIPFSQFQIKNPHTYKLLPIGLTMPRDLLYQRIEQRVDQMLAEGLVEEVYRLSQAGYNLDLNAMNALGYKQVYYYLQGWATWEEMVDEIKLETRRFAKRQCTWFRKDKRIHWFDVDKTGSELVEKISALIEGL